MFSLLIFYSIACFLLYDLQCMSYCMKLRLLVAKAYPGHGAGKKMVPCGPSRFKHVDTSLSSTGAASVGVLLGCTAW
jgi:hypothetical protein